MKKQEKIPQTLISSNLLASMIFFLERDAFDTLMPKIMPYIDEDVKKFLRKKVKMVEELKILFKDIL